ncbi:MAG TPA: hypothetical protein P5079_10290, partial [Elusimicrobiota bacterium]|nr:hypothetical protein [Elusimicrobiota bacterium]
MLQIYLIALFCALAGAAFFTARIAGGLIASPTLRTPSTNWIRPLRPRRNTPRQCGVSRIAWAGQTK